MASFGQGALVNQHTDIQASGIPVQLVILSTTWQRVLGDVVQTIILPECTQMKTGRSFIIHNMSKATVTIKYFGGIFAASVLPRCQKEFFLYQNDTPEGTWVIGEPIVDTPLAIYASRPFDGYLNVASNKQKNSDGSYDSSSPVDFSLKLFPGCRINFQATPWSATGGITDLDGNPFTDVLREGEIFTRPSNVDVPVGKYIRMVMAYKSFENQIDVKFSEAADTQNDLTDPGILSSYVKGDPIGHVDFLAVNRVVGVNTYYMLETVGTETGLIENGSIVRYKKDGGPFVSKLNDLSIVDITGNVITIEGGSITLADGRVLSSYEASDSDQDKNDYDATLTYDMTDDLLNLPGPAYHLYIDLITLPPVPDTILDTSQEVYPILSSNLRMLSDSPEFVISMNRYIPISSVYDLGGGTFSFINHPPKRHEIALGADGSLEYSTLYVVGGVGDVGQIKAGHFLTLSSFPYYYDETFLAWYNFDSTSQLLCGNDLLDMPFTNHNGVTFNGVGILGEADSCANFLAASSQYLSANYSFFNAAPMPGSQVNFSVGGWVKPNSWFDHDYTLFFNAHVTPKYKWTIGIDSTENKLKLYASTYKDENTNVLGVTDSLVVPLVVNTKNVSITIKASSWDSGLTGLIGLEGSFLSFRKTSDNTSVSIHGVDDIPNNFKLANIDYSTKTIEIVTYDNITATALAAILDADDHNVYIFDPTGDFDGTTWNTEVFEIQLPSTFSGWHFIAITYAIEFNTFSVFVDNVKYEKQLTGKLIIEAIQDFAIGYGSAFSGYLDGYLDEFFYCQGTLTEDEVRKIRSYKLQHDRYLPSDSQEWIFWLDNSGQRKQYEDRVVDSDEKYVWYDLLEYPANQVSAKLYNVGHVGLSKPAKPRTIELTVDALDSLLPLEHRLGVVPEISFKLKLDGDPGFYEYLPEGDYFVASSTHIKLKSTVLSLVDALGSGEVVILNYSSGSAAHFVPNRFWNTYLVSSDRAVLANDYVLVDTTGSDVSLTLPSNPRMGDQIIIGDARNYFGFNSCFALRNGNLINGKADSSFECDISGKEYVFTYTDATYGWAVYF